MNNKTIRIKFDGNDVIIDIIAKEAEGITNVVNAAANEPAKPVFERQLKKFRKTKVKPVAGKKPGLGRGNRVTPEMIDQIKYLRDEEKMTSRQVADELGMSLNTVNRHYRPLSSER
jgi:hypothetical protein